VPNALPLPEDLIALGVTARQAELAMEAASRDGGDVDAAREAYLAAGQDVYSHPLLEQARQEGCHAQTWQALKDATRDTA